MHHEYLIRDRTTVWTGSANLSDGAFHRQDVDSVIIHSTEVAALLRGLPLGDHVARRRADASRTGTRRPRLGRRPGPAARRLPLRAVQPRPRDRLSAHPTDPHTGIVWAVIPYGDANQKVTSGRLLAYDATHFDSFPDGSTKLRVLWDSQDWDLRFSFNKFNRPVVFGDRLFVPTYDDRTDVYELA